MHKPLTWIKKNLIFLKHDGPDLVNKPIGHAITHFQEEWIRQALTPSGDPNKNLFLGFARKISKSMVFSWIISWMLETKEGFNIVLASKTHSQTGIIYDLVKRQIINNQKLKEKDYKIVRDFIEHKERENRMSRVFSEGSSNLGLIGVQCLIGDELGAMRSRENLDNITSGMSFSRPRRLLLYASNPPEFNSHWSNEFCKTLKMNPKWSFYDYSAPPKDDPHNPETWAKANPFVRAYLKTKNPLFKGVYQDYEDESADAQRSAENLLKFKRLGLGQRVSARAYQWIDVADIKTAPLTILEDTSLRCIAGFDLALSRDFCSCCLCFFDETTEKIYIRPFLHLANTEDRNPSQRTLFEKWDKANFIKIQNRKAISKEEFEADILDFVKEHGITIEASIWDRNLSQGWTESFEPAEKIAGTGRELTHAIRFLEARAREGKVFFLEKNPALLWMFENAVCSAKSKSFVLLDRAGDINSNIDGAVSCVLATRHFVNNRQQSFQGFAL